MKLTASNAEAKPNESLFEWIDQWYPIAPIQDLDMRAPNHAQLLGMDLVVWFHSPSKTWQIFRDPCPHRLAPLSEGRIDANGNLQASEP
jgi:phenylpropionate dioxygenase-like ring-hydroxylating dioxygenase large terminal subunit